jgi:HEAT repeat protein
MAQTGLCLFTGECVAKAYRGIAEGTRKIGAFFARAARAAGDRVRGLYGMSEDEDPGDGRPGQEGAFRYAIARFKSPDPAVRSAALRVFARIGKAESIAMATALLTVPDAEVRGQAQDVLRELSAAAG